jgi:hypothetical protein
MNSKKLKSVEELVTTIVIMQNLTVAIIFSAESTSQVAGRC